MLQNDFDKLKASAFKEITKVMGFEFRWLSGTDGVIRTATHGGLFKHPSLKEKQFLEFDDKFWEPENRILEYLEFDFPGLFDTINKNNTIEKFEIGGEYFVAGSARRGFDGDTVYVQLFPDTESFEE